MTSICNRGRRLEYLAALAASLALVACLDVEKVELHPSLVIDDFEDGDQIPNNTKFIDWFCFTFDPQEPQPTCDVQSRGPDSNFALSLPYTLQVPPDTDASPHGVGVGTKPKVGTVDLTFYDNMHFSAKLVSGTPAPREKRRFTVRLGCNTVQVVAGSLAVFWVENAFTPTGNWSSYDLALSKFIQPNWQAPMDHPQDCPMLNDSIRFETNAIAGDSEAATFMIDDVYFR
jgi:hypothetical protein